MTWREKFVQYRLVHDVEWTTMKYSVKKHEHNKYKAEKRMDEQEEEVVGVYEMWLNVQISLK